MPKCVIDSVTTLKDTDTPPIVVEFENAVPSETKSTIEVTKDPKTKSKQLTITYNENKTYKGCIGEGYPTDLMQTYLAIRDKTTNKMRFVEVEQCRVKSSHHDKAEQEPESRAIDARSLLLKNFGSKSAARAMDRREKTAYNSDIARQRIDESINASFNDSQILNETTTELDIAPPSNKDAAKVSEAYTLSVVIPREVLHALETPALTLIEMKAIHLP